MIDSLSRSNSGMGEHQSPKDKGSWAREATDGHSGVCYGSVLKVSGAHAGTSSINMPSFYLERLGIKNPRKGCQALGF